MMKSFYFGLSSLILASVCQAGTDTWQWLEFSHKHFQQDKKLQQQSCTGLCRKKNSSQGGVINMTTGNCDLILSGESVDNYEVHQANHTGQFMWYLKESSACLLQLRTDSVANLSGDWNNCHPVGETFCRFKQEGQWVTGIREFHKNVCVGGNNSYSTNYYVYQLEPPAYRNYEFAGYFVILTVLFTGAMVLTSHCIDN